MALKPAKKHVIFEKEGNSEQGSTSLGFDSQQEGNHDYLKGGETNDEFFKDNDSLYGSETPLSILLDFEPDIPEGNYKFGICNLNIERGVNTRYGTKDKIIIDFHLHQQVADEIEEYHLKQKYNKSINPRSTFYNVYKDLTGKAPMGSINLRNLLNIRGTCDVEYVELDDGGMFPKIVNIKTYKSDNSQD